MRNGASWTDISASRADAVEFVSEGNDGAGSRACATAEHHRLSHSGKAQQMRFYFRRIQFFSRDIDQIGNPAHDLEPGTFSREQIVGNESSGSQFPLIGFRKIAVAHCGAAHAKVATFRQIVLDRSLGGRVVQECRAQRLLLGRARG